MDWNCKRCDFEMVEVQRDILFEIIEKLTPNFLSLPKNWKSIRFDWIQICPRCDKFGLGFAGKGYPIRTQSGEQTTINGVDYVVAHDHREPQNEILSSELCGCFACLQTFSPDQINQWHGEGIEGVEPVALCPECSIDSVIGSSSGFPIEHSFLEKMKDFWFSPSELSKTMGD